MSCQMFSYVEIKTPGTEKWEPVGAIFKNVTDEPKSDKKTEHPFDVQNYGLYAFLAGVNNYSDVVELSKYRGLPPQISSYIYDQYDNGTRPIESHSLGYLYLNELLRFDYNKKFKNNRFESETYGQELSYKEFLPKQFFADLEVLKQLQRTEKKYVRIVFWFYD